MIALSFHPVDVPAGADPLLDPERTPSTDHQGVIDPMRMEAPESVAIRPQRLAEFVGQSANVENLRVFIAAAQNRSESLDHVLLHGPPGLGKTTLAGIVSKELDSPLRITSGPAIARAADLAAILTSLSEQTVLFIDEIHRLPKPVEETLYGAMEDGQLDIMIGSGPGARSVRLDLPAFTLIGATTRAGLLSNPLHDRFGIIIDLDYYTIDELTAIINRLARLLNLSITPQATHMLASRSRGTPRVAGRLLRRIRDFAHAKSSNAVDAASANSALEALGIDEHGLTSLDRLYLHRLGHHFDGGPVGLGTLSVALSTARDTLEEVIEPYLIRLGLLSRSTRGRILSPAGRKHLKLPPTQESSPLPLLDAKPE